MRKFVFVALFVSIFLSGPVLFSSPIQCAKETERVVSPKLAMRKLSDVKELKVMSYNVLNLFLRSHEIVDRNRKTAKKADDGKIVAKSPEELRALAKVILENDPDVLTLIEVDNIEALAVLNEQYLGGRYRPFLIEGNDQRGIDVGFLVKADLPLDVEIQTHKDTMWTDPETNEEMRLFSRDVPALLIRREGEPRDKAPLMIVLGNHAKSMRDRSSDKLSSRLRTAQYEGIGAIIDKYQGQFGKDVPILLDGDFNTKFPDSPELAAVRSRLADPFVEKNIPEDERISHSFPKDGELGSQLDNILITKGLVGFIKSIFVYRYKDKNGNEKPLPTTFEERDLNPSDHFPVVLVVSTEPIFPEAHGKQ